MAPEDDAVVEQFRLALPAAVGAPGEARHILDTRVRVPEALAGRARLLVSEIVTYRVRHGGLAPTQQIELVFMRRDDALRVELRDDGAPYQPAPTIAHAPEGVANGEWGLMIVDALSDAWGTDGDDARTTIWFELHIAE